MNLIGELIDSNLTTKIFIFIFIIILSVINYFLFKAKKLIQGLIIFASVHILFGILLSFLSQYTPLVHFEIYMLPSVATGYLINFFADDSSDNKDKSPFLVPYNTDKGIIEIDLQKGLAIFGAAGSGKSRSGFVPIFKHAAANRISLINYDYKDFELTEMMNYFYAKSDMPVYTISPARPDYSNCINPIDPKYLHGFADVNTIASVFISNLSSAGSGGDNRFFAETSEAGLAGIIWRLKEDYPELCNIPYAASIIMTKEFYDIGEFIKKSDNASLLAKPYLDSMGSDKQMAAVQATLTGSLRKVVSPEIFAIFSKSDFDLDINNVDNPRVLNLVNHPKYDTAYAPFLATTLRSALMQMSERGRNPTFINLDEASTFKLDKMSRIPATLRSYGIGTIFGLQDKVQGVQLYGENELKAILTNLGSKILGKANDPDTSEYYQKLFELIQEDQKSISKGTGWGGGEGERISISQRERAKHRAFEFNLLKPGEFFIFDQFGKNTKVKFKEEYCEPTPTKAVYNYSKTELDLNFKNIIAHAKTLQ